MAEDFAVLHVGIDERSVKALRWVMDTRGWSTKDAVRQALGLLDYFERARWDMECASCASSDSPGEGVSVPGEGVAPARADRVSDRVLRARMAELGLNTSRELINRIPAEMGTLNQSTITDLMRRGGNPKGPTRRMIEAALEWPSGYLG
jgi:hypothetical protein